MEFHKLYAEVLAGRRLKLQFTNKDELAAFRNSFAVYCHRQTRKLIDCGMATEYKEHSLQFSVKDCVVEVKFERKEKRTYNFTIIEQPEDEQGRS